MPNASQESRKISSVNLEGNRASVDLVVTECAKAETFLDVAITSQHPEVMERRRQFARRAYDTALHSLRRIVLTPAERKGIEQKLSRLKIRLASIREDL